MFREPCEICSHGLFRSIHSASYHGVSGVASSASRPVSRSS
ncbi:hypothetical protein ABID95_004413 [Streptomyces atratus]